MIQVGDKMTEKIEIKIDTLFKLQKTLRENRIAIKDDESKVLQRHDLKVRADLIDRIIKDNGIDKLLDEAVAIREHEILLKRADEVERRCPP